MIPFKGRVFLFKAVDKVLFRLTVVMMLLMSGFARAECKFAEQAEKAGKLNIAYMQYIYCAEEENDSESQYKLGTMFYQGVGLPRPDFRRAVFFFSRAANNGYAPAQVKLGLLYWRGEGVEKNLRVAHKWLYLAQEPADVRWFYYFGPSSDANAQSLYAKIDSALKKSPILQETFPFLQGQDLTDFLNKGIIPSYREVAEFQHEKMMEAGQDLMDERSQSDLKLFLNSLKPDIDLPVNMDISVRQKVLSWLKPAMLTNKNLTPAKIPVLNKLKREIESPPK